MAFGAKESEQGEFCFCMLLNVAMAATRLFDTSDAVELFAPQCLYLKPIARLTISVMFPESKISPRLVSNWEVMEILKKMAYPDQITSLKVSRSTMDFIRFEAEVENKNQVQTVWEKFNNKTIKMNGINETAKVLAVVTQVNFPSPCDWESFFKMADCMNEALPGERPDTIHMEGLPCKWLSSKQLNREKPMEEILQKVFGRFGEIRNVDIPMLDPYREEMTGKKFNTFSLGGLPTFEAYIQYQDCAGFVKAMESLRGMKLMHKGDDGKALACNIKVTFDTTKHLSDSAIEKRNLERLKLQELEKQREEQKRRDKEEEQAKEAERRRREDERERERRRKEKLRRREHRQREREERRRLRKQWKIKTGNEKEQKEATAWEERKLVLAQRKLDSYRLLTVLLNSAKLFLQKEMRFRKRQLPESDTANCNQKKLKCEHVEENERLKPGEDVAGKEGFQKVETEEWKKIKMVHKITDEKHKSLTGANEPLRSQTNNFPFTTSLIDMIPVDSKEQHGPVREKGTTSHESGSLQITVIQDCGAHLYNQHTGGYNNYLCNRHSRKVTTVDRQIRHQLYSYEDFVSCLLDYHQLACPSDLTRANICLDTSSSGNHSEWRRIVSDNGESFRIDLKNKSNHLCTKVSATPQNRWHDYDHNSNYRWTITISESGAKQKASSSSTNHQLNNYNREFQLQWKDLDSQLDFRKDLTGGSQLHLKDIVGVSENSCVASDYSFKNQEGKLVSNPENLYCSTKDLWISSHSGSKEPWKNPTTNWKISIKNTQNNVAQPRLEDSNQSRNSSKKYNPQLKSHCKVTKIEPGCPKQECTDELKQSNKTVKRIHKDNACEFSAVQSWSNCKSGIHQEALNHKPNKKSQTCSNDTKPAPSGSRSELKYPWKENESKLKEELNNSGKPCRGHQRKDLWDGEGSGKKLSNVSDLGNQLSSGSEVFSDEAKHKIKESNTVIIVHPKDKHCKRKNHLMDSNRDMKTHWKGLSASSQHVKNEWIDNYCSYERGFSIHHGCYGNYSWPHERDFGHHYYHSQTEANGNQTYFHKQLGFDDALYDDNRNGQKMKKHENDTNKFHLRK
ncbi:A-kinase anchor protein 17B-like isoform X1 [Carcharodon carcharias]|uniref:A-kinase anchor protein 17B-like isoform X1 n=1 Tax=Carcharodon carcharias TaxID=13397 RepID=UPI001B7DF7DD|nr:A-kinase anchor protein 17B-like isoform X1 [Carcharodon carcharias]